MRHLQKHVKYINLERPDRSTFLLGQLLVRNLIGYSSSRHLLAVNSGSSMFFTDRCAGAEPAVVPPAGPSGTTMSSHFS